MIDNSRYLVKMPSDHHYQTVLMVRQQTITWADVDQDLSPKGVTGTQWVNSLWSSDAISQQRSGSTLAQVMACCLTAASHYLNQSWLIISEVQWHSYQGNFTRDASTINHWNPIENYISKISFKFPRPQWVKILTSTPMAFTCPGCMKHSPGASIWKILKKKKNQIKNQTKIILILQKYDFKIWGICCS